MDEYQHFERLDADGDFEGGQWVGGEYVYTKRKRKVQQTEDDRLYGVFQGSSGEDSDEDGAGFGRRRRKKGSSSRSLHKEVAFVSKGLVTDTTKAPEGDEEAVNEEEDSKRGEAVEVHGPKLEHESVHVGTAGLGAGQPAADPEAGGHLTGVARMIKREADLRRAEAEAARGAEQQRRRALKQDPELAKFESHGTGIGSKLMRAMGWKPGEGLGARRHGIAAPVQASLRPKGAGLGAAGKEAAAAVPPRVAAAAARGGAVAGGKAAAAAAAAPAPSAFKLAWKADRRAAASQRDVYKSAEEVLREREEAAAAAAARGGPLLATAHAPPSMTVLDMTGPQTRVVKDLAELSAEGGAAAAAGEDGDGAAGSHAAFPEVQHNLKLLVELAEQEIARCDARARHERDAAVALRDEEVRLAAAAEALDSELARAAQVLDAVEAVEQRKAVAPVSRDELLATYATLKADYPAEYKLFDLAALALSQLLPLLQAALAGWALLEAPLQWLPEFAAWRPLLYAPPADSATGDAAEAAGAATDDAGVGEPFAELLGATVLPPLRRAVMGAWRPTHPGPLLLFCDHWLPVMPPGVRARVLRALVLPRLLRAIQEWEPGAAALEAQAAEAGAGGPGGAAAGTSPLPHVWLHPWLPHLEEELAAAYPTLRTKLATLLQNWRPWESVAKAALAPWRRLWRPRDWADITGRVIVPPLEAAMHELLSLNPLSPDTRPCDWAQEWDELLSAAQLAGVYERAFFPRLHIVLHTWLSHAGVIHDEVWTWLDSVKARNVPAAALAEPRVRHQIAVAVAAISDSQKGLPLPLGYPTVAPPAAGGAAWGGAPDAAAAAAAAAAVAEAEAELAQKGIKDFLAEAAAAAGLPFVPRRGRQVAGVQVFALGTLSVIVDIKAAVVKAFLGDRWVPMGLDEVVQEAQRKGGRS